MKFAALFPALLFCACSAFAQTSSLLPSCGNTGINFKVTRLKDASSMPPITPGTARLVLLRTFNANAPVIGSGPILRFGMDGNWIGAGRRNTYVFADIAPGEHHLCTAYQSEETLPQFANVTAEAGKTYYFRFAEEIVTGSFGIFPEPVFKSITTEEGVYRLNALVLSSSTPKR